MSSLKGKIVLVTGASGGIGRATAIEVAGRGATVALHYRRSREGAEATADAVADRAGGQRPLVVQADVARAGDCRRLVAEVEAALGRVDVLVNNAGDLIQRQPLVEMPEALWHEVIETNLSSLFYCSQAVAPGMVKRKQGVIVNMASLAGWNGGGPGAFAYSAAKAGAVGFSKAIAKELAPYGIRVNCVSPGLIDETGFHARFTPPAAFEGAVRTIPLGRAGRPDEVAKVIAFLASDDASFVTGETIEINGGAYMR